MTDNRIPITAYLSPAQYRQMQHIAVSKTTDVDKPVHVHHLLEHLVAQALTPRQEKRSATGSRAREKDIRELHALGLNDREIAEAMGIHPGTVHEWRHTRLKLPKNSTQGQKPIIDPTKENHS